MFMVETCGDFSGLFPADEINLEGSLLSEPFVTRNQSLVVPVSNQNNWKAKALGMWDHIPSVTPQSQSVIGFSKTQMFTEFPQIKGGSFAIFLNGLYVEAWHIAVSWI